MDSTSTFVLFQFQSTHPHRVRLQIPTSSVILCHFNPRTHIGCEGVCRTCSTNFRNFNPRTHTGCDLTGIFPLRFSGYFNPRTHTGCDGMRTRTLPHHEPEFQSTHPHRVRRKKRAANEPHTFISIHAPTQGATETKRECSRQHRYFNPRTHTGCDYW